MNARADLASIIIVNKNDRGIDTTLNHLKKASPGIPFEVIVVDSSLPGKMADIQAKHGSWITWDQFPYSNRRTTPEQRNRGLELANGNLIVFIDANCVPGPKLAKSHRDYAIKRRGHRLWPCP
jgi:glycosyltransferase involved in cell wall biosynthesis